MVTVTVIGLGFVGLTTALGLAEIGHKVYGYDTNTKKIKNLLNGNIDFFEPHMEQKLSQHLGKRFHLNEEFKKMISATVN